MRTTTTKPSGLVESRVRCQVACPVREAAPGKRTGRKTGTAPRADFTGVPESPNSARRNTASPPVGRRCGGGGVPGVGARPRPRTAGRRRRLRPGRHREAGAVTAGGGPGGPRGTPAFGVGACEAARRPRPGPLCPAHTGLRGSAGGRAAAQCGPRPGRGRTSRHPAVRSSAGADASAPWLRPHHRLRPRRLLPPAAAPSAAPARRPRPARNTSEHAPIPGSSRAAHCCSPSPLTPARAWAKAVATGMSEPRPRPYGGGDLQGCGGVGEARAREVARDAAGEDARVGAGDVAARQTGARFEQPRRRTWVGRHPERAVARSGLPPWIR